MPSWYVPLIVKALLIILQLVAKHLEDPTPSEVNNTIDELKSKL